MFPLLRLPLLFVRPLVPLVRVPVPLVLVPVGRVQLVRVPLQGLGALPQRALVILGLGLPT